MKPSRTITLDLTHEVSAPAHSRKSGQLTVYAEESFASKTTTELVFRCSDLEGKDLFSKSVRVYFPLILPFLCSV